MLCRDWQGREVGACRLQPWQVSSVTRSCPPHCLFWPPASFLLLLFWYVFVVSHLAG